MPVTIDVPVDLSESIWTVSQLATEIGIDRSNCQRYITRLMDNGHQHFRRYRKGDPLTSLQRRVVFEFRRLSTEGGRRGDGLWREIASFPRPPSFQRIALAEVCDRYQVSADLIEQMVQEIIEVFNEA